MAEITLNKQHPLYQEDLEMIISTKGFERLCGKSFLITGATGLIGVCMIDALMKSVAHGSGISVYAVGRSKDRASSRLGEYYDSPAFHFIEQDVCQPFPTDFVVDYIIPLASNTHPLAYSQYPIETISINVKGAENTLELAARCGAEVLYPSTVEVYGNARGEDVFTEDYTGQLNLATSRACYTESKRVVEAMCQSYLAEKGVKCKIARLSRVFGPSVLGSDTKASSQFINKALNREDIVLKSKGNQYFSFIYSAEAVSAMFHILLHGENGRAYNVANSMCNVHLADFAKACADYAGTKVVFDIPSEVEQKGYSVAVNAILDTTNLSKIGWKPIFDYMAAINRTIEIVDHHSL